LRDKGRGTRSGRDWIEEEEEGGDAENSDNKPLKGQLRRELFCTGFINSLNCVSRNWKRWCEARLEKC